MKLIEAVPCFYPCAREIRGCFRPAVYILLIYISAAQLPAASQTCKEDRCNIVRGKRGRRGC